MIITLPQIQPQITRYSGNINSDIVPFKKLADADAVHGGMSSPSKMPGLSYSIPASRCITGGTLRNVAGSACFNCYAADDWSWAKQGGHFTRYAFDNVKKALERRYQSLFDLRWVPAMIFSIMRSKRGNFMRWHDSGDLQSPDHLFNICQVAVNTPQSKHWLPTREYNFIRDLDFEVPQNLVIRVSAHMIDKKAPKEFFNTSTIASNESELKPSDFLCCAYTRGHVCGDCRACWDNKVQNVAYLQH